MILKLGAVALYVDDQNIAVNFWVEKVGFKKVVDEPGLTEGWRRIELANEISQTRLVILPKEGIGKVNEKKANLMFDCENIEETILFLTFKGVQCDDISELPFGKFASFVDPEGNQFFLRELN